MQSNTVWKILAPVSTEIEFVDENSDPSLRVILTKDKDGKVKEEERLFFSSEDEASEFLDIMNSLSERVNDIIPNLQNALREIIKHGEEITEALTKYSEMAKSGVYYLDYPVFEDDKEVVKDNVVPFNRTVH